MNFSSKILLFGEYCVIKGSKGMAFPFTRYSGQLKFKGLKEEVDTHLRLDDFASYIKNSRILSTELDIKKFEKDIEDGIYFDSNIPHGYGVGSSGALCAAIYSNYSKSFERKETYTSEELNFLQDMMALMESFYHGTSSGVDCLISLIDKPVLIQKRNQLQVISNLDLDQMGSFHLVESGIQRKTSPLVHSFLNKFDTDQNFHKEIDKMILNTNLAIDSLLNSSIESFQEAFINISKAQFVHFSEMIPNNIKNIWFEGLESKKYFLKLCGAGGGGFFLVYSLSNKILLDQKLIELSNERKV